MIYIKIAIQPYIDNYNILKNFENTVFMLILKIVTFIIMRFAF